MYFNGIFGVHKDAALGLQWMSRAADQGDAVALYELGHAYEFGQRGVSRDQAKAIYWYQEAAERGHIDAQYRLGLRYELGDGLPKDIDQALFWLRKAAEHDQSELTQNLAEQELARLEKRGAPR
jgi:TPR repeat protein